MYELEYVKKKKRKKIAVIIAGISTIVVTSLAIVAFLGRYTGTFTVSLDSGNVGLSLSEKSSFAEPTSYLRVNELPEFGEFTYANLPALDDLDNENNPYLMGAAKKKDGTVDRLNYFKYTFHVKNTGAKDCGYRIALNIVENSPGYDGRRLDDTLRVEILNTNLEDNLTKSEVYAKKAHTPHLEGGEESYSEAKGITEKDAALHGEDFPGYAKEFEAENRIYSDDVSLLKVNTIRRYTIVMWLEGYDPESLNVDPPKGASLKLGVNINAYEI